MAQGNTWQAKCLQQHKHMTNRECKISVTKPDIEIAETLTAYDDKDQFNSLFFFLVFMQLSKTTSP